MTANWKSFTSETSVHLHEQTELKSLQSHNLSFPHAMTCGFFFKETDDMLVHMFMLYKAVSS